MAKADVDAVLARWAAAFAKPDPEAMAALYTQEAIFIGGLGGLNLGQEGVRAYFEKNVSDSRIEFRDVTIRPISDDVVCVAMIGAISRGGGPAADFRFLQTHVRTPAGWRIASHHGSRSAA